MSWDDIYQMGGEGGGNFVGTVADAFFEPSEYGIKLHIVVRRSHPELTPASKPEVSWTYSVAGQKERDNWTISASGAEIVHAEGKSINGGSDLGKFFKSVKDHVPPIDGFNPQHGESWRNLPECEWGWAEEPKRKEVPDSKGGMKWVVDHDKDPNRRLVIVSCTGGPAAPDAMPEVFDLALIPSELLGPLQDAARVADGGSKDQLLAQVAKVPGALQCKPVMDALQTQEKAQALQEALTGVI